MDIDEDVAAEGFTSMLLGFTDNLNEDPIYFMGLDKLDPAHLVKLPPSAVQKYPKLRETIEKTYNDMISANIKIGVMVNVLYLPWFDPQMEKTGTLP